MNQPCQLTVFNIGVISSLQSQQTWQSSEAIENEEGLKVILSELREFGLFLITLQFEEIQEDIQSKANIDKKLERSEVFRKAIENEHEWGNKEGIYCESIGHKVPDLWQSIVSSNDVPLPNLFIVGVDAIQIDFIHHLASNHVKLGEILNILLHLNLVIN